MLLIRAVMFDVIGFDCCLLNVDWCSLFVVCLLSLLCLVVFVVIAVVAVCWLMVLSCCSLCVAIRFVDVFVVSVALAIG